MARKRWQQEKAEREERAAALERERQARYALYNRARGEGLPGWWVVSPADKSHPPYIARSLEEAQLVREALIECAPARRCEGRHDPEAKDCQGWETVDRKRAWGDSGWYWWRNHHCTPCAMRKWLPPWCD
jgi:hypothetical protein